MKRGGELKRAPLKRGKPLRRTGGLKRRRVIRSVIARQLSEAWAMGVRGKACAVCRNRPAKAGHHVLRQQIIRRERNKLGLDTDQLTRKLWDTRNRLPVCGQCHASHHNASHRIPFSLVQAEAPKAIQFARELGLLDALMRDYAQEKAA